MSMNRFHMTPEQAMRGAWASTGGDPLEGGIGIHQGNPNAPDLAGNTKAMTHDAARGDLEYFQKLLRLWTPATRTYRKKRGKGFRPIDNPSEDNRIKSYPIKPIVVHDVEEHGLLTDGQIAYRGDDYTPIHCTRPGATDQDHLAVRNWKLLQHRPVVVQNDHEDAFGLTPHGIIHDQFKILDYSQVERRYLIRLSRINSIDPRHPEHRFTRRGVGLAQGHPLSATLLNLAMAPLLGFMDDQGFEHAAYADDVGIFTTSREEAHKAFKLYKGGAGDLGFENVRDLGTTGKASRIVDTRIEPLELINTYLVTPDWIGLTSGKLDKLKADLDKKGITTPSPNEIRKISGCQAISKKWMRMVGLIGCLGSTAMVLREVDQEQPAQGRPADHERVIPNHGPPSEEASYGRDTPSTEREMEDDLGTNKVVNHEREDTNLDPMAGSVTDDKGRPSPYSKTVYDAPECTSVAAAGSPCCSREPGDPSGRAATPSRGRVTPVPRGGRVRESGARPPRGPVHRILDDPEVVRALREKRKLSTGVSYKGGLLDLRELMMALKAVEDDHLVWALWQLCKAGRQRNVVWVLVHEGDAWTATSRILGNQGDAAYEVKRRLPVDGGTLLKLRLRPRRGSRLIRVPAPRAQITVLSAQGTGQPGLWAVRFREHQGKARTTLVKVSSPVRRWAWLEAVSRIAEKYAGSTVAMPSRSEVRLALDFKSRPANVMLARCRTRLRASHRWSVAGVGWFWGEPQPITVAPGGDDSTLDMPSLDAYWPEDIEPHPAWPWVCVDAEGVGEVDYTALSLS